MFQKVSILFVMLCAAGLTVSCAAGQKVYGPNETVVYDDGDLVITSEKTEDVIEAPAVSTSAMVNGKNVWRISQEVLKYYRQGGTMYVSGQLKVTIGVNNIAYNKTVGVRYTVNNWASYADRNGSWSRSLANNSDEFTAYSDSTIAPGSTMKYALYYKVNGATYWDNCNGTNYAAKF